MVSSFSLTTPLKQQRVQLLLVVLVSIVFAFQIQSPHIAGVEHESDHADHRDQDTAHTDAVDTGVLIDINVASRRELSLLPSVGPVLASRIVVERSSHGPFHSIADLKRVHGLGDKRITQIASYCTTTVTTITTNNHFHRRR